MNKTIEYYNNRSQEFEKSIAKADMQTIQDYFLSYLSPGDSILDLGCGTGRDSRYFLSKGFNVTAVDGSEEMCRIARKNTHLPVKKLLFEDLRYEDEFSAVFACSSLLHVPSENLRHILSLVRSALKDRGIFYCSFKYGDSEGERNGRYFTDLTETALETYVRNLFQPLRIWVTSDVRSNRHDEKWLNAILRKI